MTPHVKSLMKLYKKEGIEVLDIRYHYDYPCHYDPIVYIYKGRLLVGFCLSDSHCYHVADLYNTYKLFNLYKYNLNYLFFHISKFFQDYRDDYDIKLNKSTLRHCKSVFFREKESDNSICLFNDLLLGLIQKKVIPNKFKL